MRNNLHYLFLFTSIDAFNTVTKPSISHLQGARAHVKCSREQARHVTWRELENDSSGVIMKKFFHTELKYPQTCEIFCIDGVPAASFTYSQKNNIGEPIVDAFHFNRAMILMFDAGPLMRRSLFERYRMISIQNAKDRNVFLAL